MKKIYLTLASAMLLSSAFSQAPLRVQKISNSSSHKAMPMNKVVTNLSSDYTSKSSTSRATTISENLNAIGYISNFLGSTPYLAYTNPIFPDSNVIVAWASGPSAPWLHAVCQTFDLDGGYLRASTFDPMVQPYDVGSTTMIDSISIQGFYARPNTSSVDTAIISIIADNNGNYTRAYNSGTADSVIFVIDDANRDNAPDGALWTGKIVLDAAFKVDTISNGSNMFVVAPGFSVPAGANGIIGVTIEFKPGNSYSQANDTIFSNQNYINVVYGTPQGQSTDFPLAAVPADVTCGAFADDNTKFSATGFDYYLPPVAFTTDHPYQLYDVTMKVSQNNGMTASTKELDNGAKLFQNYPNPTNGNTTINYSLENNANVSFEMIDITGKVVLASNEGNKANGMHSLEVNTSELTAGIYFYSLTVNNNRMTKKMTITK